MPRIRTIKPEAFSDPELATCSIHARYLFHGLISFSDDEGRQIGSIRSIAGNVFPHDADVTERAVGKWLGELEAIGSAIRYEVAGAQYLWLPRFALHQRVDKPQPSRLPAPPEEVVNHSALTRESFANSSRTIPAVSVSLSVSLSRTQEESFATFWQIYPRKAAKGAARKAFAKALARAKAEDVLAGAERYRDDPNRDASYTAHPSTWLNGDRWDDDPLPPRSGSKSGPKGSAYPEFKDPA